MHLRMIAMQRCIDCPIIWYVRKIWDSTNEERQSSYRGLWYLTCGYCKCTRHLLAAIQHNGTSGTRTHVAQPRSAENSATERMVEKPSSSMFDKRRRE
ncbi:hypothetical protein Plhal703r1_c15g0073231 [Plasmopara halstedii]